MEQNNTYTAEKRNLQITGWKSYLPPVLFVLLLFASILGSAVNMITRTQDVVYSNMQERLHENAHDVDSFVAKPLFRSSLFDLLANVSGQKAMKAATEVTRF